MIVSHHGQYEWQSPKRPKFLEAAILHQLDMMDAQVDMFTEAAAGRDDTEDNWAGWVRGLDRYVFCG
jgi:3'-5' exoribonuclease